MRTGSVLIRGVCYGDVETSARLLRLLALLQARGFWSGADLAERLEVTARTVRRDVDRLRSLGYPVGSSVGVAGGYQLGAGASLPPLQLEDDEALAVALGLRTAAAGGVAGVEHAAVRALAKLEQVMPKRLRRRVNALNAVVAPLYYDGPGAQPQALAALALACHGHHRATFRYADGKGRASARATQPHGLVHTGSRWYLVAWDDDREDWRTFRVDRIADRVELGTRFVPREIPGKNAATFVARSVASRPYPFQARVVFHAPKATVAPRIPPSAGYLEALDADRCRLQSGAHSLHTLAIHIALVGEDFEIEEPPELIEHVKQLAARMRRATTKRAR